jgi:hypothetical protein
MRARKYFRLTKSSEIISHNFFGTFVRLESSMSIFSPQGPMLQNFVACNFDYLEATLAKFHKT